MQTAEIVSPVSSRRRSMYVPRVDLYGPAHKGLRWTLARVLAHIGSTSPAQAHEAAAVLGEIEDVLALLESHLAHEEAFIHPAIEARCSGGAERLERGHKDHESATSGLRVLLGALRSGSKDTLDPLWRALYLRFADFVAENLAHMAEEEEIAQPLLEELYTTEELYALQQRLLASIPSGKMLAFARVMLPANDMRFRVAMLAGMRASMPADAFGVMFATATVHLSMEDIADLAERLETHAAE